MRTRKTEDKYEIIKRKTAPSLLQLKNHFFNSLWIDFNYRIKYDETSSSVLFQISLLGDLDETKVDANSFQIFGQSDMQTSFEVLPHCFVAHLED